MNNPFARFPVSGTWQEHLDRRSLGGIDYAMPVNTPLPAPSDGVLSFIPYNGTGGHTAIITRPGGSQTVYMHLGGFFGVAGPVKAGDIVGFSGGVPGTPGAGLSDGPHLHAHDIAPNGMRVLPFGSGITALGLSSTQLENTPPEQENEEPEMIQPIPSRIIRNTDSGDIAILHPAGWELLGGKLIPEIADASGAGLLAGQPKNADGYYWIDLSGDRFGWEIARHEQLLKALDDRIRSLVQK